jgi:hypothetical protein
MPGLVHGTAAVQQLVGQVHPTLVIALGGTGKEIALRLRQRFFEKYGVTGFPTVGYLWIDTDMQNNNIDNRTIDYIGAECLFKPGEYVDAQIDGKTFQDLFTRSQFFPNIFRWIYPDLGAMGAVVDGAQATRPLGRLAFFKAFPEILAALVNQVAAISSAQAIQNTQNNYGINVQPTRIEFKLLFSVAGGTGSGMFLDMAFLLRHLYQNENPDIIGYLVLPCIFGASHNAPRSQREYANGYAALKELEYYSMRKDLLQQDVEKLLEGNIMSFSAHDFDFQWNDALPGRPVMGPPFNTCYLISNRTETGGHIQPDEKTFLCDMLAESLFMDFHADAFSIAKRSVRSNLIQYLGRELEYRYLDNDQNIIHDEIFSCRFSAMGFSMIHVPLDRMRMACGYRLGEELMGQLLSEAALPADLNKHLREYYLEGLGLRITKVADDFTPELTRLPGGLTFAQDLKNYWRAQQERLLNLVRIKKALGQALDDTLVDCQVSKLAKPRDNPKAWGEYPKALLGSPRGRRPGEDLSNKAVFLQDRKGRLAEQVRQWVKADHVRFQGTLAYLEELKNILDQHQQFFISHAQQLEKEAAEAYDAYSKFANIVADEERRGQRFYHQDALKILVVEATERLRQHCELHMRSQVAEACADICQDLMEFVDRNLAPPEKQRLLSPGLVQKVEGLRQHCLAIRDSIATKLESFAEQAEHFIFENVYHPDLINNFYRLQDINGNQYPVNIDMMEGDFYNHFQISSVMDLLPDIEAQGLEVVAGKFEDFCHEQFKFLTLTTDAVREFFMRYPTDQVRQQRLANFANRGMVWIRPGVHAAADQDLRQTYTDWVAIGLHNDPHNTQYQQVRQVVEAHLVQANLRRVPTPPVAVAPDAVYLYSERSGLPLPYLDRIEDYRQAYFSQLSVPGNRLHIDRNESRFIDVTVKNTQEVQEVLEAHRLLLLGAILRIIGVDQDRDGQLIYALHTGRPATPRLPLGILTAAVEGLRRNQTRCRSIARSIAQLRHLLSPELQEQFLTLLFYHISDGEMLLDPNDVYSRVSLGPFPKRFIPVGGVMVAKESLDHRILNEALEEGCKAAGLGPGDQFRVFRTWYPRLDQFSLTLNDGDKAMRIFRAEALDRFTNADGLLPQNWDGNG